MSVRTTVRRAMAVATVTLVTCAGTAVGSAAADPWLSWTVITDVTLAGRASSTVSTADPAVGEVAQLARTGAALAVDASADGQTAAYLTQVRASQGRRTAYRIDVMRNGARTRIPVTGISGRPDTSPDGTAVSYGRVDGTVETYDLATGQRRTLCTDCTGLPARYRPRIANVAVSPDGSHVAVMTFSDGDAQALVIYRTADGARLARRTMGEGEPDAAIAWTADGSRLAFVALGPPAGSVDELVSWRIVTLGLDGSLAETAIRVTADQRLSGPMRVGDDWYAVSSNSPGPTGRRATLLTTPSLDQAPTALGTVTTRPKSRTFPFVGSWSVSAGQPVALSR